MTTIEGITNDKYKIKFKIDCENISLLQYKWYAHKRSNRSYLESIIRTYRDDGKRINKTLHKEVLNIEIPNGMVIDHINGDVTDNTGANLRIITDAENKKAHRCIRITLGEIKP